MLNLKKSAAPSMMFVAFFSGASLAEDTMPVTYPVSEQETATSPTCQQAREIAEIYRELDKTDGNVPSNEPLQKCDGEGDNRA